MSLAEKLKSAGADTVGASLTVACTEAIRLHPHNAPEAWRHVGNIFGIEFIEGLMGDMKIPERTAPSSTQWSHTSTPRPSLASDNIDLLTPCAKITHPPATKPYRPRVISPDRLELRAKIVSKYKNSAGVAWSDVSWHELIALARDGTEAKALLDAAGQQNTPNDGRTAGEVLGVAKINQIIEKLRE